MSVSFVNSVADGTRKAKETNEKERKHTLVPHQDKTYIPYGFAT